MSSAIRDSEKLNQIQIQAAKNRANREVKNIEEAHEEYKTDLKKTHESEIVELRNINQKSIGKEAEKKEKVLNDLKTNLLKTSELTEKELKSLKDSSEVEKFELKQKLSSDKEKIIQEHEINLQDINQRFNHSSQKIVHEGKRNLESTKRVINQEKTDQEKQHQEVINKQNADFQIRFKTDGNNYKKIKHDQDLQFKKDRMTANLNQQREMQKMADQHTNFFEKRDTEFRKALKEQDLFFEKKFETQTKSHNENFKQLEEKNEKVIGSIKGALAREISQAAIKRDDPFYKFDVLNPKLKQFEDRVEIEVQVPDHSKQDLQLTINGKEAIVAFNRRYQDAAKTPEGNINKINKIESFTTRLQTDHFLNAKSIKSKYENGVMTYTINKA